MTSPDKALAEAADTCVECGSQKFPRDCYNCGGEGVSGHDCGEDTCCCHYPEDNVTCGICKGDGGWLQCANCHPWED